MTSVNDPIADFLTRIRNAGLAKHDTVSIPHSKLKVELARILKEEGYIVDFEERGSRGPEREILITLKYTADGQRAISGLRRMSRPGRRVYRKQGTIPRVLDGLGVAILSTSHGVQTDHSARRMGVGGEVLCFVY
ncbi:30S ribosomal protein S8 [Rubrobacter aplysinae]|jgi:small subunit ribosomal protein S8|uniref:30S ribosomal protein S8 n=1 Tax=Rubrobacter aplysinae TaxID=909625 RepID=UPI00064B9BB2|nr:30S ribosomal protein S8 [Rubrobacter aplysinae]